MSGLFHSGKSAADLHPGTQTKKLVSSAVLTHRSQAGKISASQPVVRENDSKCYSGLHGGPRDRRVRMESSILKVEGEISRSVCLMKRQT